MTVGTVVVLNPVKTNEVMPSSRPYDVTVAGVVSHRPGVLLGHAGNDKAKIATTGGVKVRVDATLMPVADRRSPRDERKAGASDGVGAGRRRRPPAPPRRSSRWR
jgi:hypothetical protein